MPVAFHNLLTVIRDALSERRTVVIKPIVDESDCADVKISNPSKRRLPGEDRERAVALYNAGLSLRATAAELGCSAMAVRTALRTSGVELRPPTKDKANGETR